MTLLLNIDSKEPIEVKTHGTYFSQKDVVRIGDYEIGIIDFLISAEYVLTNTNLYEGDPRLMFLRRVKEAATITGWSGEGQRIKLPDLPQYIKE